MLAHLLDQMERLGPQVAARVVTEWRGVHGDDRAWWALQALRGASLSAGRVSSNAPHTIGRGSSVCTSGLAVGQTDVDLVPPVGARQSVEPGEALLIVHIRSD